MSNFTNDYTSSIDKTYGIYIDSGFNYTDGEGRPEGLLFNNCIIYGADYDVYLVRCLFAVFNNCIFDGANENAVRIASTSPQGVRFDKCYFYTHNTTTDSSIVYIAPTIDSFCPISITNSDFVATTIGDVSTEYGIYFKDGGYPRFSCNINNNTFRNLIKGIALIQCPNNSSICNNVGDTKSELIFIQNNGFRTVVDNNRKIGMGSVVKLFPQSDVTSVDIDIRNNSSDNLNTYKLAKVTIPAGQNYFIFDNEMYNSEIGLRVQSIVTPITKIVPFVVRHNLDATSKISIGISEVYDTGLDFIIMSKVVPL